MTKATRINKKEYRKAKRTKELKDCAKWSQNYFGGNGRLPF